MAITENELAFIRHYSLDGNGTAADRAAGHSEKGARQAAYKIVRRPEAARSQSPSMPSRRSDPWILDFLSRGISSHVLGDRRVS